MREPPAERSDCRSRIAAFGLHPGYAALLLLLVLCALPVLAADDKGAAYSHDADIPAWFKETFLELPADIREAAASKKRLMVYFGQDGCPYCGELMRVNFSQKDIADRTRQNFEAIALNVWGDRPVTWVDGKLRSEKEFAAFLKVQFTPTLLFLDEQGAVVLRLNGYYPPHKFRAALDYAADRSEGKPPFGQYLAKAAPEPASGVLHEEPFFRKPPHDFARIAAASGKPLAILFEQKDCAACDELHARGFRDASAAELLPRFEFVRLELFGNESLAGLDGTAVTEADLARSLGVAYTPTIVFFDSSAKEVFRVEAYLKPFHLASSLEYVATGAYRTEPSFQRFLQARAQRIRGEGQAVELWK